MILIWLMARVLSSWGKDRYQHVVLGYNFRMTDMATIGLVQLKS